MDNRMETTAGGVGLREITPIMDGEPNVQQNWDLTWNVRTLHRVKEVGRVKEVASGIPGIFDINMGLNMVVWTEPAVPTALVATQG